jgi:hypothetical protein
MALLHGGGAFPGLQRAQISFAHRKFTSHPQPGGGNISAMGLPLCTYQVGQRTVQLFELANGHIQWVCNCDDYAASAGYSQGAWCKHVAKASAIRSIERLTGARVVGRSRAPAPPVAAAPDAARPEFIEPAQAFIQPG